MLHVTTRVDCDSCKRTTEVDVEPLWDVWSHNNNVILVGVGEWLKTAGWSLKVDDDTEKQFCPNCKEEEQ